MAGSSWTASTTCLIPVNLWLMGHWFPQVSFPMLTLLYASKSLLSFLTYIITGLEKRLKLIVLRLLPALTPCVWSCLAYFYHWILLTFSVLAEKHWTETAYSFSAAHPSKIPWNNPAVRFPLASHLPLSSEKLCFSSCLIKIFLVVGNFLFSRFHECGEQ